MFVLAIIFALIEIIQEKSTPTIPAENWRNMELYRKDVASGVPIEMRMKYLAEGKYK